MDDDSFTADRATNLAFVVAIALALVTGGANTYYNWMRADDPVLRAVLLVTVLVCDILKVVAPGELWRAVGSRSISRAVLWGVVCVVAFGISIWCFAAFMHDYTTHELTSAGETRESRHDARAQIGTLQRTLETLEPSRSLSEVQIEIGANKCPVKDPSPARCPDLYALKKEEARALRRAEIDAKLVILRQQLQVEKPAPPKDGAAEVASRVLGMSPRDAGKLIGHATGLVIELLVFVLSILADGTRKAPKPPGPPQGQDPGHASHPCPNVSQRVPTWPNSVQEPNSLEIEFLNLVYRNNGRLVFTYRSMAMQLCTTKTDLQRAVARLEADNIIVVYATKRGTEVMLPLTAPAPV